MSDAIKNIAIIGTSGALGSAFRNYLSNLYASARIHTFSRHKEEKEGSNIVPSIINYQDEKSIEEAALGASKEMPLDLVIVATGILHKDDLMPEKSLKDLSVEKFQTLFEVNTIIPALVAKHFLPKLNKDNKAIFAALSARVGSISDNQLGGWYAYRASKAALNMIIKTAAIEVSRSNKQAVVVGLHPGTVDSKLSEPFKSSVPEGKLFKPEFSVEKMIDVLNSLTSKNSGKCFAWDGEEIDP